MNQSKTNYLQRALFLFEQGYRNDGGTYPSLVVKSFISDKAIEIFLTDETFETTKVLTTMTKKEKNDAKLSPT